MKLNRKLYIADQTPQVIEERVVLQLNSPARAQFVIYSPNLQPTINQAVAFDIGYNQQDNSQRLFLGYVEKVVPQVSGKYQLFCRELSAVLNNPLPLSLRHCSLKTVLKAVHEKTGLNFSIPEQDYSENLIANFFNLGNGYQVMQQLGKVFKIPDFIWQQQGKGIIYVGSWAQSRWANREVVLPADVFNQQSAQNSAKILAIPALRPGVELNGLRIDQIEFSGNHMVISWN